MFSYPKSFKAAYIIVSFSYSFITSAFIKSGCSSHFQNKLTISNKTIGIMVLKNAEAFGGKIVCIIGKCRTNCKALIIPNINYSSPEPRIFSKRPNMNIYFKPSFALLDESKNVFIAAVSFI